MKKTITSILLSIYMLAFSELPQLLKIPVFIAHFHEHKQIDPETTVWGFVREHYQGKFVVDDDYERDMELPFRTTNIVLNTTVICAPPMAMELPFSIQFDKQEFTIHNDDNNPVSSLKDIFQPPRLVTIS